jgi:SAM-dependent methyltransferase
VAFRSLAEYPLAMVLACMLATWRGAAARPRPPLAADLAGALAVVVLAAVLYSETLSVRVDGAFAARVLGWSGETVAGRVYPVERFLHSTLQYGPPLAACVLLRRRPVALGAALGGLLLVAGYVDATNTEEITRARSFFGVLRDTRDRDEKGYTELRHGTTLHGRQAIAPARRGDPVSYYHRRGPIGRLFAELEGRTPVLRMAVIGLGTGTLAAYARPGDRMTFYEIDPVVRDIAFDPTYFTFLSDAAARAAVLRVEMGDARVRLEAVKRERPGEQYDLMIVDAFSSDAIPVHLLTRQAVRLYLDVLAPGGVLVFHISNRYLELEPVVANLAEDAGLAGRLIAEDDSDEEEGSARSTWVALARSPLALGRLARDEQWTASALAGEPRVGVWTDDFHNLLSVFKWR